jgi:hypothetical protein
VTIEGFVEMVDRRARGLLRHLFLGLRVLVRALGSSWLSAGESNPPNISGEHLFWRTFGETYRSG